MSISIQKWEAIYGEPISIESINKNNMCDTLFRVYERIITSRSNFMQTVSLRIDVFVISGTITYSNEDEYINLSEGEFASLHPGSYKVENSSFEDANIILASHAPPQFISKNR